MKTRNGEETKSRVLEAAERLFAERGFDGVSLAMIAERSGISTGLALHHFKSKDELYRQVLRGLAERYREAISAQADALGSSEPAAAASAALEAAFRFWSRDETYERISLWSYLEGRTGLEEAEAATTAGLAESVGRLQGLGLADPAFEPFALLAMTIGPVHFWLRYRGSFKSQLGLEGSDEELDERFLSQYVALVGKLYEPAQGPGAVPGSAAGGNSRTGRGIGGKHG